MALFFLIRDEEMGFVSVLACIRISWAGMNSDLWVLLLLFDSAVSEDLILWNTRIMTVKE